MYLAEKREFESKTLLTKKRVEQSVKKVKIIKKIWQNNQKNEKKKLYHSNIIIYVNKLIIVIYK